MESDTYYTSDEDLEYASEGLSDNFDTSMNGTTGTAQHINSHTDANNDGASDATASDATASNATASNATASNATASNATTSNASANIDLDGRNLGIGYQRGAFSGVRWQNKEQIQALENARKALEEVAVALAESEFEEISAADDQRKAQLADADQDPSITNPQIQKIDKVYRDWMVLVGELGALESSVNYASSWADSFVLPVINEDTGALNYVGAVENVYEQKLESTKERLGSLQEHELLSECKQLNGQNKLISLYDTFRRKIFDVYDGKMNQNWEVPPIEYYLYGDKADEDEDMVVARERVSYKCPLTKQWFANVVTSKLCGHSFSKAAIYKVIGNRRQKCPVPACRHFIEKNQLVANPSLQERADREKARELRMRQQQTADLERL